MSFFGNKSVNQIDNKSARIVYINQCAMDIFVSADQKIQEKV